MNDEIIKGNFYEKELQKTKNNSDEYIIEKILKTNKRKFLLNGEDIQLVLINGLTKIM